MTERKLASAYAAEAASHWEDLASQADRMADWEETQLGWAPGANRHKAKTYRDAAKALRLEAETGIAYCVCCLKPVGHKQR